MIKHLFFLQDTCEGLCKLFVSAGQETLPLMLNLSEGDDDQRHVATKLVSLILVSTHFEY